MNPLLRLGLLLGIAVACGAALWDRGAAAGAPRVPEVPVAPLPASASPLPAGGERDLVRALAAVLLPEQRTRLLVAPAVTAAVLLGRAVEPDRVSHGRGVQWAALDPLARALVARLVEHVAALARGDAGPALVAAWRTAGAPGFAVAVAGNLRGIGPLYLRLHGETFAAEWLELGPGQVHCRWREFGPDAALPWLRDELVAVLPR